MSDMLPIVDALFPPQDGEQPVTLHTATVTADNGDGTVAVSWSGGMIGSVPVDGGAVVHVDEPVQMLLSPQKKLVLGAVGPQSGTNGNGSWTYIGRILIQWHTLTPAGNPTTWTFPVPFGAAPVHVQATPRTTSLARYAVAASPNTIDADVSVFSTGGGASGVDVQVLAIGPA